MAYVNKTFVIPDLGDKKLPQSTINPATGMANDMPSGINPLFGLLQQSAKPIKNRQVSTETPYAQADMIARRNMIGARNQNLLDALKPRESFGYNFGAGLANLEPVSGYGNWGVYALRAFGGAMNRPIDNAIAREQMANQLLNNDLKTALAFDKEMGRTVDTDLGYMYPKSEDNSLATLLMLQAMQS